jgi:FemAB-related protein (PEP-CTERM system-associated)
MVTECGTHSPIDHGDIDAPLSVALLGDDAAIAWDSFIESQPTGSFYHLHGWKAINEAELGHTCQYLTAMRPDGSIAGALPLVLVASRLFGRILCSMPFVNYGGPVSDSDRVRALLAYHATLSAEALGTDYLELRCAAALHTGMTVSLRKVSMPVALRSDAGDLFAAFSQKHRKNIRRAMMNGLTVDSGGIELLPDFYKVLERSWRALGTPLYRQEYFRSVLDAFPDKTRIFVCRSGNRPAAVAMNGYSHGTVEGMWAGVEPDLRHLQPNYVLY